MSEKFSILVNKLLKILDIFMKIVSSITRIEVNAMKEKRIPSIFGEAAKIAYVFADVIPHNESFYNCKSTKMYDAIFVYELLHKSIHGDLTLFEKVNRLKDALKPDGHQYIYYHFVDNNQSFVTYPYNGAFL